MTKAVDRVGVVVVGRDLFQLVPKRHVRKGLVVAGRPIGGSRRILRESVAADHMARELRATITEAELNDLARVRRPVGRQKRTGWSAERVAFFEEIERRVSPTLKATTIAREIVRREFIGDHDKGRVDQLVRDWKLWRAGNSN